MLAINPINSFQIERLDFFDGIKNKHTSCDLSGKMQVKGGE